MAFRLANFHVFSKLKKIFKCNYLTDIPFRILSPNFYTKGLKNNWCPKHFIIPLLTIRLQTCSFFFLSLYDDRGPTYHPSWCIIDIVLLQLNILKVTTILRLFFFNFPERNVQILPKEHGVTYNYHYF